MNVVMIIPTGIGCEIGGHCGDGSAAARLLGACCDTLVLHPNVVNASDINEMPGNSLYVEGSHLDRFLQGEIFLKRVPSNKVLVVVNKADYQSINAVSAARATPKWDSTTGWIGGAFGPFIRHAFTFRFYCRNCAEDFFLNEMPKGTLAKALLGTFVILIVVALIIVLLFEYVVPRL